MMRLSLRLGWLIWPRVSRMILRSNKLNKIEGYAVRQLKSEVEFLGILTRLCHTETRSERGKPIGAEAG